MARVSTQTKNRAGKPIKCGRCGEEINPGERYSSAAPGYRGRTLYRCAKHPFRPSELTTSARSAPLAALESFEDQCNEGFASIEDLTSAWEDFVTSVREYADERESALDMWENGNSQLEELRDTAEQAADEAEQHEVAEFDEEEPERGEYAATLGGQEAFDAAWAEWSDAHEQHVSEQASEALDVAQGLDF